MTARLTPPRLLVLAAVLAALAWTGAATSCTADHHKGDRSLVTVR